MDKGKNEKNEERKKKRKLFPIIFFSSLLILFVGTYLLHPYIDKPSGLDEKEALQKANEGNLTGAIDEYNKLLNKEKNPEKRCMYLTRIAKLYSQLKKEEIAKGYYKNAADIAGKKNFSRCMYEAMFWRWYYEKNATCLMKAVEIAENLNDSKKKFYSYSQLANYYLNSQNFAKAKEFYDKAMKLSNNGDDKTIGYNFLGIGMLYTELNNEDALQNLKQAEIYLKKVDDKEGLLSTYMAIAYIYAKNNDTKNAMDYYKKADKISNISNKFSNAGLGIAYAYMMIAQKKLEKGDYDNAIEDAKKALNLYIDHHGSKKDIAKAQNILCYAYFGNKQYVEADQCYNFLDIGLLDKDENKFKGYVARAKLNEFFGTEYKGIEVSIVEGENGTMKRTNVSCGRILRAINDYEKAVEIGKRIGISDKKIKEINAKISELKNKGKECR